LNIDPKLGLAGLPASAGVAGWVEFLLLRGSLRKRIGSFSVPVEVLLQLWSAAAAAAALSYPLKPWLNGKPLIAGMAILPFYGLLYLCATLLWKIPEAQTFFSRFRRR
jgi:putative peptidoglycan lipid II flippase